MSADIATIAAQIPSSAAQHAVAKIMAVSSARRMGPV